MKLESFQENLDGKDYIIGDIHGCYDELIIALRYINFNFDHDRLFCVGDVVDRGTVDLITNR